MTDRRRIGRGGAKGGALVGRLALGAALVLLPSGAGAEPVEPRAATPATEAEPQLRPGIPGLKMADVRDHRFLWREIDELQVWERGDRISVAEYRSKVIEKTVHFLGLGGVAAEDFAAAAAGSVAAIRESFLHRRGARAGLSGVEAQFSTDLGVAVSALTALLRDEPRHRLFAPEAEKWLLKLAFGPSEAKEAREAEQAHARGSDKPSGGAPGG